MTKKSQTTKTLLQLLDVDFFKALSDPVRLEILRFLLVQGRADISTVAEAIARDRSVLSRHLHLMAEAGLLKTEKVARNTYFELNGSGIKDRLEGLCEEFSKALKNCC